jgi:hypothetical protein
MAHDITKLPAWVREQIKDRDNVIAQLKERVAKAELHPPSKLSVIMDVVKGELRYFDDKVGYRFEVGPGHWEYLCVSLSSDRKGIDVMGGEAIDVRPCAGNHAKISISKR